MLIDYVMPYALRRSEGKADSVTCKLRYLAELRPECQFRLFAPYCDYRPSLPSNVRVISQSRLVIRILQEFYLNAVYIYHLLRRKPQCLVVRPDALFVGHILARLLRVRIVLNIHAYVKEECKYVYRGAIGAFYISIVHAIFRLSLKIADGVVFNHPDLQKYVVDTHSYHRYAETIYNGANTERFFPVDKQKARQALSLPADKKILLFLGSVARWHGVDYLIEIASLLQARSENILLYIVGGQPATERHIDALAARAPANVVFTGKVGIDEANLYVNAADVCLLPVKKIRVSPGSPRKLFDYVAAGRPVITQEGTIGYSDLVESYGLGYVLDFTNAARAASLIQNILAHCDEKYYVVHNREVSLIHLSWRNVAAQWSSFLDKVCALSLPVPRAVGA